MIPDQYAKLSSVFKRRDGRWCVVVNPGWQNGKLKCKYFYGDTHILPAVKKQAAEKMNAVLIGKYGDFRAGCCQFCCQSGRKA